MLRKNVLANLFSNIWGVISVFIFVPIYIKFLGIEAYGLVGFYATLIGFLSLADMGFTMTLKRELARLSALNDGSEMKNLLRSYEILYGLISLLISLFVWFLAPLIAQNWLKTTFFKPSEMISAIRLMGISIAIQLPAGLFIGGLMGLQHQVLGNFLNIAIGFLRGIGAIVCLYIFPKTIFTFFLWQLFSNVIYFYFSRFFLWKIIKTKDLVSKAKFSLNSFRRTGKFALSMAIMSIIGVLLNQTDKIIVGKFTSLVLFSYYSIAASIASIPIMISGAIGTAIFPQFAEFVAVKDSEKLKKIYILSSELIGVLVVPIAITLIIYSGEFILAWTGSIDMSDKAKLTASLLLIGQLLQSITLISYNYALAFGNVKFSQKIGMYSILIISPLLIFLTIKFSIIGAAVSWLLLNFVSFPFNIYYLNKQKLLSGEKMWSYSLIGVIRPIIISLLIALSMKFFSQGISNRFYIIAEIGFVWIISCLVIMLLFPIYKSSLDLIFNTRKISYFFKNVFSKSNG